MSLRDVQKEDFQLLASVSRTDVADNLVEHLIRKVKNVEAAKRLAANVKTQPAC